MLTAALASILLAGCVSFPVTKPSQPTPDDDGKEGGITSRDLRTVASRMTPAILSIPAIANSPSQVVIKIADVKNSSRFFIDSDLVTKLLRVELNRHAMGKVGFINDNRHVRDDRRMVQEDLQEEIVQQEIKKLAGEIARFPVFQPVNGKKTVLAVIPVINTNLVNMNADSFANMIRSEIVSASGGNIQFLLPNHVKGADYYLTGLFYPESMKKEGIINLADYIHVINTRINAGKSLTLLEPLYDEDPAWTGGTRHYSKTTRKENILQKMLRSPELRAKPNTNNRLIVMIAKPDTKVVAFEKSILLSKKLSSNARRASLILSSEISALSKRRNGISSDYIVITTQLTDTRSNIIIWEDSYEVKRISREPIWDR